MSSSTENQETKTYSGRCHCQAIIFEVTIPPLETGATEVMQCNCSICMKKGYWLLYPLREDVKFLKGEDQLKDYYFATKTRAHRFCPECGTSVLIDYKNVQHEKLKGRLGISMRTLDNIDELLKQDRIKFTYGDGKHKFGKPYEPTSSI